MTLEGAETCQPVLIPFPSGVAWAHSRACRIYPGQKISPQAPWHDGPEEGGEEVAAPDGPELTGTERGPAVSRSKDEVTPRAAISSRLASVQRLTRRHAAETWRVGLDEAIRRHPANGFLEAIGDTCPAHPHYLWWECPTCSDREAG